MATNTNLKTRHFNDLIEKFILTFIIANTLYIVNKLGFLQALDKVNTGQIKADDKLYELKSLQESNKKVEVSMKQYLHMKSHFYYNEWHGFYCVQVVGDEDQDFRYFSSLPVFHYLQTLLLIKIWTFFMNILYNTL